jgi:hypothetical protein
MYKTPASIVIRNCSSVFSLMMALKGPKHVDDNDDDDDDDNDDNDMSWQYMQTYYKCNLVDSLIIILVHGKYGKI